MLQNPFEDVALLISKAAGAATSAEAESYAQAALAAATAAHLLFSTPGGEDE